jgi:hypothetical protein
MIGQVARRKVSAADKRRITADTSGGLGHTYANFELIQGLLGN